MEQLKIAILQLNTTTNIKNNFNKNIAYIKVDEGDSILFPECSLIGKELLFYQIKLIDFINKNKKTVVFGSILKNKKRELFNSAFVVSNNSIIIYKKII
ncbi:hypothetical protein JCM13304A_21320 [Desulfothermus okinawensis JCM 13304]